MYQRIHKAVVGVVTAAGVIVAMAAPVDASAAAGSASVAPHLAATRHAVTPATPATFHLRSANGGRCVAVDSNDGVHFSGSRIVLYDCINVPDQIWHYEACFSDGHPTAWCHLVNGNGFCLAVPGGSLDVGVQLIQWPCGNFDDHYWRTDTVDQTTFNLINYHSGQVMTGQDANNWAAVVQWTWNPNDVSQHWFYG